MKTFQRDNSPPKYDGWLKERVNSDFPKKSPYPNDPNEDEQRRKGNDDEKHIPEPIDPTKKEKKYGYDDDVNSYRKEQLLITIYGPILCAT
jgi:hypothetical protein